MNVRTIHRQLTNLLSHAEQAQLQTRDAFEIFLSSGMNPIQYNPYTNPVWKAALQQYESFLKPAEQRIGQKLKGQLKAMQDNVLQASEPLNIIILFFFFFIYILFYSIRLFFALYS